jgi:hypothetical protein
MFSAEASDVVDLQETKKSNNPKNKVGNIRVMMLNFIDTKLVINKLQLYAYNHKIRAF